MTLVLVKDERTHKWFIAEQINIDEEDKDYYEKIFTPARGYSRIEYVEV